MSTPTDPYNSSQRDPREDDQLLDPIDDNHADGPQFSADEPREAPRDSRLDDESAAPTQTWNSDDVTRDGLSDRASRDTSSLVADDASARTGSTKPTDVRKNDADQWDREFSDAGSDSTRTTSDTDPKTGDVDPIEDMLHTDSTDTGRVNRTSVLPMNADEAAGTATRTTDTQNVGPTAETGVTRTSTGAIPTQDGTAPTTAAGVGTAAGFTAAGSHRDSWTTDPGEVRDIPDEPAKRTGAHVASFFLILLLLPVAWYLISDAGARLALVDGNPWDGGNINIAAILELVGGLAVVAIMWMITRASSLGAQFWGAIVAIAGIVAIAVPDLGRRTIDWLEGAIGGYNNFTENVVHHLNLDLGSGRIATFGFILFMTGLACHFARRDGERNGRAIGRRTELLRDEERVTTN